MSGPAFRPHRRHVLCGGLSALAAPALAAPSPTDARPWIAYESRLRARLADAGGGRFDLAAAREALALTNTVRRQAGAPAVAWHEELAETARAHAADLAHRGYFEHLSPETFDPSHRFWLLARRTIGSPSENIAYRRASAPATAGDFMHIWRGSPPHWRNLLRPTHTHAGFGMVRRGDKAWLVGLYARPVATLPQALPFRPDERELARALVALPEELGVGAGPPQGADWRPGEGRLRVMQLSGQRRVSGRAYEVIGGPIFVEPA